MPVTKYLNDNREKIDIIIEELSVGLNPNKKLKSYLSEDVEIVSKNINNKSVILEYKENSNNEERTENIDKTVALSLCETYKIEGVELNKIKRECKHI